MISRENNVFTRIGCGFLFISASASLALSQFSADDLPQCEQRAADTCKYGIDIHVSLIAGLYMAVTICSEDCAFLCILLPGSRRVLCPFPVDTQNSRIRRSVFRVISRIDYILGTGTTGFRL